MVEKDWGLNSGEQVSSAHDYLKFKKPRILRAIRASQIVRNNAISFQWRERDLVLKE